MDLKFYFVNTVSPIVTVFLNVFTVMQSKNVDTTIQVGKAHFYFNLI